MINFNETPLTEIPHMRDGNGTVKANVFSDKSVKIMRLTLEKGVSIGLHCHENNFETIYVLSGEASCETDGAAETVPAGCVHYCPMGSRHTIENRKDEPLVLLAVIPQ